MSCDDLRLGGTLSGSGLTGGTSINSTSLQVSDWSDLLGVPGLTYQPVAVHGRPGSVLTGDGLARPRLPTLNMRITRQLAGTDSGANLETNTDTFLGLLGASAGQYLEVDLCAGGSRFIHVRDLDPALVAQRIRRTMGVPLYAEWPYWWEGGAESTDTLSGADTLTVGGNAPVYDAVLVFAGDGTATHNALGWSLEIAGSSAAVTVDLGARTVVQSGTAAPELLIRDNQDWGWFTPGSNSVTTDVSVGVTWRDQYV